MLVLLLMLLSASLEAVNLGALFPFISVLTAPETVLSIPIVQSVASHFGILRADQIVLPITLIFISLASLAAAFRLLVLWIYNRYAYSTGHDLSVRAYETTLYQPYFLQIKRNSSEVISGIHKVDSANQILFDILGLANAILTSLAVVTTAMIINPLITSLTILTFGLLYSLVVLAIRRRLYKNSKSIAEESIWRIRAIQDGLGAIREVLLSGSQFFYKDVYSRSDRSLRNYTCINNLLGAFPKFVFEALGMSMLAMLAYVLSFQTTGLVSFIPMLGVLALGAQRLLPALQTIFTTWAGILGTQSSLNDALDLIEQPMPEDALLLPPAPLDFQNEIRFEDVFFRYDQNGPWVLNSFDLQIIKGSRVGLVGKTGCGKSTTLDLLMGLLIPTSGRIVVDGLPLSAERMRAWQCSVAHVPQDIFLFDSSIAENIAFGEPPDAIDMERVRKVSRQAQIAEFIESEPEGYNLLVGERGISLSGGQRQRVGIARALYKRATVLVFDEATNALDNTTELEVINAIESLGAELTILIIAHRLTTLRKCDMIVKLENGKVIAQGSNI